MQEREYTLADGRLYYKITQGNREGAGKAICITRFQGQAGEVRLPARMEGLPVTTVGKKAFLSRKNLYRVILPDTLEEVEDWAFAYCSGLKSVEFPGRRIQFGRSVFLECTGLERIVIEAYGNTQEGMGGAWQLHSAAGQVYSPQETETRQQIPGDSSRLLAAAVTMLDAPYLLDTMEAGTVQWLAKWDAKLIQVMHTPDQEGYSRQVLCGEEDYGSTDLTAYISGRRKEKVRLCYLRLLYPQGLSRELQRELEAYLCTHTKGRESQESWQVLLGEHGMEREYYSLFAGLGCVDAGNLGDILEDIGEAYPEMKAYFLTWKGKKQENQAELSDFFADFEL